MSKCNRFALHGAIISFCMSLCLCSHSQKTVIRGFADLLATYEKNKTSFGFGEQDLFITSELNDRLSFLGESVFKFTLGTPTNFSVSIERLYVKYNIAGNHSILFGKQHTPINYWNATYHHGRVFFPTIERPLLFAANLIPLHTTGVTLQGHDLGSIKFGYDLMIGNGIGSGEITDNDKYKSVTAAAYIKPANRLQLGITYYNDVISKGASVHGHTVDWKVYQQILTASAVYFGNKFEFLSESSLANNYTDTTGSRNSFFTYLYAGFKIKEKFVPYFRLDYMYFPDGEIYFDKDNTTSFIGGMRYQINYIAVIKLEYQHKESEMLGSSNRITFQFAIGF